MTRKQAPRDWNKITEDVVSLTEKISKRPRVTALAWIQDPIANVSPKRPGHLRACAAQMRELEYRILQSEQFLREKVQSLHRLVVRHDNTVFVGLQADMQALANGLEFLGGLRAAYRILCGQGRN